MTPRPASNRPIALASACLVALTLGTALGAAAQPDLAQTRKLMTQLRDTQLQVRKLLLATAEKVDADDPAEKRVRDVLFGISQNELAAAVHGLETLLQGANEQDAGKLAQQIAASQDKAIEVLRRVLGVIEAMDREVKKEKEDEEGSDLEEDVEDKLNDLMDKLKDFVKEQRKVIEATEDLAKVPVDDFTEEDEKKLKELEATEDKWAKFLKEAHSDLSKVPDQDFTNPQLLKELVEIYSEVEMAKDALSKKALEIATPLEENGAELAESMTTHIEKWLPDTPDREKWQMEEPLQDYETPMAELPKELEDLVGELMEEEEDLMEDIEDATSAWSDSIDKGAGWDAMDGPISNMSAQGVTGNRLPNQSEIGGRSGEGRTGKSSGEFVEENAVGKGGRQTPSRLTPDPFEKGQVNDTSDDPAGGATGGGKISGAGGEGLEGPAPPEINMQMKALAGRQAELRNKAERVQMGFQVMNYPSDIMDRTVRLMKKVENGLDSGRYRNIMRRRQVMLDGLKGSKLMLKGEIRVNRDRSAGLPSHMQDEIIDAAGEPTPRGYEALLKGYYQTLSEGK